MTDEELAERAFRAVIRKKGRWERRAERGKKAKLIAPLTVSNATTPDLSKAGTSYRPACVA